MESTLITAADMLKTATKAKEKQRQDYLNHVEQLIIEAAKEGKTVISLRDYGYYEDVVNYFTPSGFLVELKEDYIHICWGNYLF